MDPSVIEGFFNLAAQAVSNRKPHVSVELPTIDDLRAGIEGIQTSEMIGDEETTAEAPHAEKAQAIATGCVPCSIGHLGTCSGLLNEAMRFARDGGIESDEVLTRVNMCMDELNTLERVDLRPEMTMGLLDWEKPLAKQALSLSRSLRHNLEGLTSVSALEEIAGKTQTERQEIGKTWLKGRLERMAPHQRAVALNKLKERAVQQENKE